MDATSLSVVVLKQEMFVLSVSEDNIELEVMSTMKVNVHKLYWVAAILEM
jgi:hypothetical protein